MAAPGIPLPEVDGAMIKRPSRPLDPPAKAKGETGLQKYNRERKEKKAKQESEHEVIELAKRRFKRCVEAESDNRVKALEDLKFKAGDQWPADVAARRNADKRPCLTINKIPTFTHQIANDIRQNRPAINISPLGDLATKESAELMASLIRAIERDSAADIAYDTAVASAVDIGFGYWRVLTERKSPRSFDQVIIVKRVRNTFTVYLDPARQEPDGCDAQFGFVSEMIDRDEFKEKYPENALVPWSERGVGDLEKEWVSKDQIRVAEYFYIEHEMRRLVQLENGHTGWYDELGETVLADLSSGKLSILEDKDEDVECQRVKWCRITALEILEERDWPGKWIPIVEVLGEEIDIEGRVQRSGVIRNAKDSQRMKNYWATAKTEIVALAPKAPTVGPEGSFEGYESDWDTSNVKSFARLEYVPQFGPQGQPLPSPTRQPPVQVSAGIVEAEKSSEQDMQATTGVRFDATLSERVHDESGKALKELRRSGDIGSFHYSDNFARSLRHMGRLLVDLIPKVMDTERTVPGVAEDGTDSRIKLDPTQAKPVGRMPAPQTPGQPQPQPGQLPTGDQAAPPIKVFNPKRGEYGVAVTIGPSYATKRIEAQEQMSKFIGAVPEAMKGVVAALMAKYSDWPGSTELFKALAKLLPPGTLMPDQKDLPPAVQAFIASMSKQIQGLMTERIQLLRDLTDKKVDQGIAQDKVNKDFEHRLLKIAVDAQKQCDLFLHQSIENVTAGAERIAASFARPAQPQGGGDLPPDAMARQAGQPQPQARSMQ